MPRSSSPPSSPIFFFSCFTNISSWKASLFLFGIFSNDDQAFKTFNPSPVSDSPSFIIFGSESLMMSSSSQIDVTTCASLSCHYPVAEISASYKRDLTSRAAVIPGDVNGDPYLDLFLCSPLRSSCYIFFGKDDGLRNVMIGVTIYGPLGAFFGFAIAGTDDMNGDGFVDMVVSALTGKACYVIYGRKSWPSEIKVTEMRSGVDGYKIAADSLTTLTGISVAGGGDMNGDGNFDVALSVFRGGVFMVYVVWEGGQDISLIEVGKGIKGFVVVGEQGYYTGLSIAGVGDLNNDGLADLVIGAIPYPDRANRQQKSHVIFGSSGSPANVFLGASTGRNVMTILGGGFLVSGPGDVNDDGISDIMITYVSTFPDGANGYIVSYPSKVSTPPSFSPSSYPSSAPSHHPSSRPSSSFPTHCPSFSRNEVPFTSTYRPSTSRRPSNKPSNRIPTGTPAVTVTPMPTKSTRSPSFRPTIVQSQILPSLTPSSSQTTILSSRPSPLPSSSFKPLSPSEYVVRFVNSSSLNGVGVVYGVKGSNEIFLISSMSSNGKRKSGWSGTIVGGNGRKVYIIYPKDPSQPVNKIILQDFKSFYDVIDLSHIAQVTSVADLSYLTNPLTLFLPDNQKIIVSRYKTMSDLSDENFVFQSLSSRSSSTSTASLTGAYVAIAIFLPIILVVVWFVFFTVGKEEEHEIKPVKERQFTPAQAELETGDKVQERQGKETRDNIIEVNGSLFSHMFHRSDSFDLSRDESLGSSEDNVSAFSFLHKSVINQGEENVHSDDDVPDFSLLSSFMSSESDEDTLPKFF